MTEFFTVASFDIGKRNFAIYVESFSVDELILKKQKRKEELPKRGVCVFFELIDLVGEKEAQIGDVEFKRRFFNIIVERNEIFKYCTHFIIERQFTHPKQINHDALLISHFLSCFLLLLYPKASQEFIQSAQKTRTFSTVKMTKPERKKFTVDFCSKTAVFKGNNKLVDFFKDGKRDDVADAMMQLEVWKIRMK